VAAEDKITNVNYSLEHTHSDTTRWRIISLYSACSDRLVHCIMSFWSVVSACLVPAVFHLELPHRCTYILYWDDRPARLRWVLGKSSNQRATATLTVKLIAIYI